MTHRRGAALRTYRGLLGLLPPDLRRAYGNEMVRLLEDRLEEEANAPMARRWRLWIGGVGDLLRVAVAEWCRIVGRSWNARRGAGGNRGGDGMEAMAQDLRYALRSLGKSPGFTFVATLTLALGIGANTAIFSVVHAVVLTPLPYAQPERLVRIWPEDNFNKAMVGRVGGGAPALDAVSGLSGWSFTLTGEGEPEELQGTLVSADHFDLLGAAPLLGRDFLPEEGLIGGADAVILSYGLWERRFGADPGILGRVLQLSGADHERRRVVGVMPPDFRPLYAGTTLWAPLETDPGLDVRSDGSWDVNTRVGRLAPDATVEQAQEQVRALALALHREFPGRFEEEDARNVTVVPLQSSVVGSFGSTLWTLLGAVGLVLLIACTNVANLLLARASGRERELALRTALGARRGRIVRQLLTETVVLGLLGGGLGIAVAQLTVRALTALAPADLPRMNEVGIDLPVLAFALGASLLASLVFGVVPALRSTRSEIRESLGGSVRGATAGREQHRLNAALVAAEVALSLVLVVGAGLMLRSLWTLQRVDPGFRTEGLLTLRLSPPTGRYPEQNEAQPAYYRRVLEEIASVAGVESVAGIQLLPLTTSNWSFPFFPDGREVPEGTPPPSANFRTVSGPWFETLRVPVLRGRPFSDADGPDAEPVGIVNEALARELWPGQDPLGKRIRLFSRSAAPFTVVGVVGDVHQHALDREPRPEIYRPYGQWSTASLWLAVRVAGDPLTVAGAVRDRVWSVDPDVPVSGLAPMTEVLGRSTRSSRFLTLLVASFGVLALLLGAVGVYGVTSYTVSRRIPEFGVRVALGATRSDVLRGAIGGGVGPALVGIPLGILGAAWASRLLAGLLFEVSPTDVPTFVGVAGFLALVAVAASYLPARRASRVDPMVVLRRE